MNQNKHRFSETPFFILGCGRSGTSLLSRMLNHHSQLAVPYESHILHTFKPLLHLYGGLETAANRERLIADVLSTDVMHDWQPRVIQEEVLKCLPENSLGGIFEAIMDCWMRACGKSRWGEKTPHHVDHWKTISQYWPWAKIIHIYRDGRDVALSLRKARFGPKTVYACASYWATYVDKVRRLETTLPANRIHALSYENLLRQPEKELATICEFLGENFEPAMLRFYENKAAYKTDDQNQRNLARPVMQDNTQKWRQQMNPAELRTFEAIAGAQLTHLGYDTVVTNPHITSLEHLVQGKVLSPFKKALAMVKNRKGHRDSWIKLKIRAKLLLRR